MALFSECMLKCARKLLDTADIVREAIFRQLTRAGASAQPIRELRASQAICEKSNFAECHESIAWAQKPADVQKDIDKLFRR
jgi:hypothetical protein